MGKVDFLDQIDVSITACDTKGTAIYMNAGANEVFASAGGYDLIGKNLADCHPGESGERFQRLLGSQKLQAYTIEKAGKRKLIYQVPMFREGQFVGYVEFSLPMPEQVPHFVRG